MIIASVQRVAAHHNGAAAAPYVSVFFVDDEGRRMHAVVFHEAGQLAVVSIDDPTERHRADQYEADLRAAIGEIALDVEWSLPGRLRTLARNAEGSRISCARSSASRKGRNNEQRP